MNTQSPSAELGDAVKNLAYDSARKEISDYRASIGEFMDDKPFFKIENDWLHAAIAWNYDHGLVGHNQLVRQSLTDLGFICEDDETGQPKIRTKV